jgi:hypothetical protein
MSDSVVPNTDGVLLVRKGENPLFRFLCGVNPWRYYLIHVPTGCAITEFTTKSAAMDFAKRLFPKLKRCDWDQTDEVSLARQLAPAVNKMKQAN